VAPAALSKFNIVRLDRLGDRSGNGGGVTLTIASRRTLADDRAAIRAGAGDDGAADLLR
jgi:hypothetical protein